MPKTKDRPMKPRPTASKTWPELARDAWAMRQEITRRLLLLDVERATLVSTATTVDSILVGAAPPKEKK